VIDHIALVTPAACYRNSRLPGDLPMMKLILVVVAACLPIVAIANDYPTLERVDHVLTCMRTNGGQTVDNLYACSCEVDIIAQQVSFAEFTEARTFEIYKRMPGEKGGLFRDNPRAEELVGKLEAARADAQKRCFIGRKKTPAATTGTTEKP
jgi:hypothetical protein